MVGRPVHLERVVDGDASTLTALAIYPAGSTTAYTLGSGEVLHITDVFIMLESGGDFSLVANEAAAGKYIAHGNAAPNGGVVMSKRTSFTCAPGVTPKFSGATTNRSVCLCEGSILEA